MREWIQRDFGMITDSQTSGGVGVPTAPKLKERSFTPVIRLNYKGRRRLPRDDGCASTVLALLKEAGGCCHCLSPHQSQPFTRTLSLHPSSYWRLIPPLHHWSSILSAAIHSSDWFLVQLLPGTSLSSFQALRIGRTTTSSHFLTFISSSGLTFTGKLRKLNHSNGFWPFRGDIHLSLRQRRTISGKYVKLHDFLFSFISHALWRMSQSTIMCGLIPQQVWTRGYYKWQWAEFGYSKRLLLIYLECNIKEHISNHADQMSIHVSANEKLSINIIRACVRFHLFHACRSYAKNQKEVATKVESSCWWAGDFISLVELRKKILIFWDFIDLPPCDSSVPINQLSNPINSKGRVKFLYTSWFTCRD